MTSNCDVTNSAQHTNDYAMPLNETPPMKIFCVRPCDAALLLSDIFFVINRDVSVSQISLNQISSRLLKALGLQTFEELADWPLLFLALI